MWALGISLVWLLIVLRLASLVLLLKLTTILGLIVLGTVEMYLLVTQLIMLGLPTWTMVVRKLAMQQSCILNMGVLLVEVKVVLAVLWLIVLGLIVPGLVLNLIESSGLLGPMTLHPCLRSPINLHHLPSLHILTRLQGLTSLRIPLRFCTDRPHDHLPPALCVLELDYCLVLATLLVTIIQRQHSQHCSHKLRESVDLVQVGRHWCHTATSTFDLHRLLPLHHLLLHPPRPPRNYHRIVLLGLDKYTTTTRRNHLLNLLSMALLPACS
jgi:hypothetical protein